MKLIQGIAGFFIFSGLTLPVSAQQDEPITLGLAHCCVIKDVFMWNVADNIQQTAAKEGAKVNFQHADGSQQTQLDQVNGMLRANNQAILASIVIDDTARKLFQKQLLDAAKAKNTPIVFYTIAPKKGYLQQYDNAYFVGSIPEQSGIMQGEMVVEQWRANPQWDKNHDGVIQYVVLKGPDGNPDAEGRTKWSQATIKNYPNAGIQAELLALKSGHWQRTEADEIINQWKQNGILDKTEVILANNDDMALGALDALERAHMSLPVFGVDALPEALKNIVAGKMAGTVKQDGAGQARAATKLALNLAQKKAPDEGLDYQLIQKKVVVPYIKVDKSNVGQFLH